MSDNAGQAPQQQRSDPNYDEETVWRAQRAMNLLMQTMSDCLTRYSENGTWYVVPDPATLGGASGIMLTGQHQVIAKVQAQIDSTVKTFAEVSELIDRHRREQVARLDAQWSGERGD